MKLLLAGLALIAAAVGIVLFTYLNPTTLFIAGVVCTFLGAINLLSLSYGLGAGSRRATQGMP